MHSVAVRLHDTVRRRPYTVLLTLVLSGLAVPFCLRSDSDWDSTHIAAALHLRAGETIYQGCYVFPPAFAWLALPFSYLPHLPSRLAMYALDVIALLIVLMGAWRLTGGGRLQGSPPVARREHAILILGLLTGVYYVFDVLSNQQVDLIIAALVIGGCLLLVRGRAIPGAVSFGLAAGLKCTPLLWAPYLAYRRRWLAAGVVVLVAIGINLVPDLTHPPPEGEGRLKHWAKTFVQPMTAPDFDPGLWASAINFNHSISGVCNRWLIARRDWQGEEYAIVARPDRLSAGALKKIVYSTCLAFVLVALLASRRGSSRPVFSSAKSAGEVGEFGLVLILMLLLSPMSSKPHFCTLLLPGFFLARAAVERRDLLPRLLLAGAIAAGLMSNKDLVGRLVYDAAIWYGSVFWNAVLLFIGCAVVLWPRKQAVEMPERLRLAA